MVTPWVGRGPFRGRGPFKGRGPFAGQGSPFGRLTGSVWTPARLFAASEVGAWYDPSDLTTLFQDAAGTTPVTAVEQPVGLMLDKSRGLTPGPELVTNGDFANGTTGWTTTGGYSPTVSGGVAVFNGGTSTGGLYQSCLTVGDVYQITYTITAYTAGSFKVGVGTAYGPMRTAAGTYTEIRRAEGDALLRLYGESTTFVGSIDNVSVKKIAGNHAFNPSGNSANFPVLQARYNLKTNSEFVGGLFGTFGGPVSASTLVGYSGAVAFGYDGVNLGYCYGSTDPMNIGDTYIFSAVIKMDDGGSVTCGSGSTPNTDVCIVIANLQLTTSYYSIPVALGNGYYRISATYTAASTSGNTGILKGTAQSNRTFKVTAYDLRVANEPAALPAYQRVTTSTDYDTVNFPPYLRFDGTDDSLSTASVNFTSTDKMSVFAGVRKLSDASAGVITEFSAAFATNSGSFYIFAGDNGGGGAAAYAIGSRGTVVSASFTSPLSYPAPLSNVLTSIGDISGDSLILRINGVQAASSTADQGTGNFGNYPLYIGRRNNATLPFNGRLFSLVVLGRAATAQEIAATESWVNDKTKAY